MTRRVRRASHVSSSLGSEIRRLGMLAVGFVSRQLDRSFELSNAGASRRRVQSFFFVALFIAVGFAFHAILRATIGGADVSAQGEAGLAPDVLLTTWRILLILGIATSLAVHFAGRYVADIFELKDVRVAWNFVGRLASGASPEVLHLREGRLAENDANSPLIQIGGPGRIVADYDTAALFEKPDGTPHVVGASDARADGSRRMAAGVELDGFERLREPVISLRDQYIGDPSGEPLTVVGRSLDGMPISVTDVRGVFSVRRDASSASSFDSVQRPFPFLTKDIENLVYKQEVEVLTAGEHASSPPGDWTAAMHGLIRDALREFMGLNRLSEFLAGAGANEAERSEYRADTILSRTLEVSHEVPGASVMGPTFTPRFRPRTELSAKFRKYGSEFSTRAQELGMELHWIGVGTWRMPDESSEEAVSAKHIEAWRMNRENAERVQARALELVTEEALLDHKLRLIQEVPLATHPKNRARYSDKIVLMECLLQDFWEQLGDALDISYRAGTPSMDVDELEAAVSRLEQVLRISQIGHVLGGGTVSRIRKREEWDKSLEGPPAPSSRAEALQYQALLAKLKGDYRVAEAMIANEKRRHGDLSREQLIARIVERFERHGH
jgi:hypothetical protein